MAKPPGAQAITVDSFSAIDFFSASVGGRSVESSGRARFDLPIPSPAGLLLSESPPLGTLAWVDGLVQSAGAAQEMIESLAKGEVPRVVSRCSSLPGNLRVHFADPQRLACCQTTVLSLFGLHQPLGAAFSHASTAECPNCRADAKIFRRPYEMGTELLRELGGQSAVVSLESSCEDLVAWAEHAGFSASTQDSGRFSAHIDSGKVSEEMVRAITPALQSAWRVPGVSLVAFSEEKQLRLAPHGACPACGSLLPPTSNRRVGTLLSCGADSSGADCAELGLKIGVLSLRGLLGLSCGAERLPEQLEPIIPAELRAQLRELTLGDYQFGARTSELPTPVLVALLAIAALRPLDGLALIDLPHGSLQPSTASVLEKMITGRAATAPTVIVGRSPASRSHEVTRWPNSVQEGAPLATLRLPTEEKKVFRGVTLMPPLVDGNLLPPDTALSFIAPIAPASAHTIRVFDSFSLRQKTVIEELGLYEPLAQLVASSLDARAFGLKAKDLALRSRSASGFACSECAGLGVTLEPVAGLERPRASRCNACDGARFQGEAGKILFRGLSFGQILNSSFSAMSEVTRALRKSSLPIALLGLLDLQHLPLGMPLSLLSFSERRRMQLLSAALGGQSAKTPRVVLVELPFAGLSEKHAHAVESFLCTLSYAPHLAWIVQA